MDVSPIINYFASEDNAGKPLSTLLSMTDVTEAAREGFMGAIWRGPGRYGGRYLRANWLRGGPPLDRPSLDRNEFPEATDDADQSLTSHLVGLSPSQMEPVQGNGARRIEEPPRLKDRLLSEADGIGGWRLCFRC